MFNATKDELDATQKVIDRKKREFAKKGENITNQELLNLCTLNKLSETVDRLLDEEETRGTL